MIPIVPKHLREKKIKQPPKEKLYSYHEVETLLMSAILSLNTSGIIRLNNITINCRPHCVKRGLFVDMRQGNQCWRTEVIIERN